MSHCFDQPRRWVHLPIEIMVRELESRTLLACYLAEAGYGVVLGQQNLYRRRLSHLPRGVYVDKCLSPHNTHLFLSRREHGYVNVGIDEEGLAAENTPDSYAKICFSQATMDASDQVYCWGQLDADLVRQEFPDAADRIRITGNPRLDLWRQLARALFQSQADQLQRKYGQFLFIPSNFGEPVTHPDSPNSRHLLETTIHKAATHGNAVDSHIEDFNSELNHLRLHFNALREVIPALSAALPRTTIVIRPHPGDHYETWRSRYEHLPNVRIVYEGPIGPWLLACRALVHCGCTSAVEAYFLDKPMFSYLPNHDPVHDQRLANTVSHLVTRPDDLVDLTRKAINGDALSQPSCEEAVRQILHWPTDRSICEQVVDAIDELDLAEVPLRYRPRWLNKVWRDFRRGNPALNYLRDHLSRFNQKQHNRRYSRQKFPVLAGSHLQGLIDCFAQHLGRFDRVRSFPLDHNLYAIIADR